MASSKEELIDLIEDSFNFPDSGREVRSNIEELMLAGNKKDASKKIALCVIEKAIS